MFYKSSKENTDMAKCVGKYYSQALYQKKISGKYHLSEMSGGIIPSGINEEKLMTDFLEAVESLREYPSNQASTYYRLVKHRCIQDESIEQLSHDTMMSASAVYRRLREAFNIIGEFMAEKGSFGGE